MVGMNMNREEGGRNWSCPDRRYYRGVCVDGLSGQRDDTLANAGHNRCCGQKGQPRNEPGTSDRYVSQTDGLILLLFNGDVSITAIMPHQNECEF
jgi:hypothetical protein